MGKDGMDPQRQIKERIQLLVSKEHEDHQSKVQNQASDGLFHIAEHHGTVDGKIHQRRDHPRTQKSDEGNGPLLLQKKRKEKAKQEKIRRSVYQECK